MIAINLRHFFRFHTKTRLALFAFAIFVGILICFTLFVLFRPARLKINFYDIGQGDGMFIETPHRVQILVDGGPSAAILEKLTLDMPFYDRTIDLLVATHPDSDHIAGLVEVLARYKVKTILLPRLKKESVVYDRLLEAVTAEGANVKEGVGPQTIMLDQDVFFTVLNPRRGESYQETNDAGVAGILRYKTFELLLTADLGSQSEEAMIPFLPSSIDVLKVAHHGSKHSSSLRFLKHVLPRLSVISVGQNRYGHPSPDVIERLALVGSHIWRTDKEGDLRIFSDGKSYWTSLRP